MNILKRIIYQMTQARQSSVKGKLRDDPYELALANAVNYLTKLGLISGTNITVKHHDEESGFILELAAYRHAGIGLGLELESKTGVISGRHCIQFSKTIERYGIGGLTAWLCMALKIDDEIFQHRELYLMARGYLDGQPDLHPEITFLDNMITTYRSLQEAPTDRPSWGDIPLAPEVFPPATLRQSTGQPQLPSLNLIQYAGTVASDRQIARLFERHDWAGKRELMQDVVSELQHYRKTMVAYAEIEALLYLAARGYVFFGTYDEAVKDWTDWYTIALNVNDTFYMASADAQALKIQNTPHLKELHEKFSFSGIAAWVALERNEEVLPALNNRHFQQAKAYILEKGWFPKSDK